MVNYLTRSTPLIGFYRINKNVSIYVTVSVSAICFNSKVSFDMMDYVMTYRSIFYFLLLHFCSFRVVEGFWLSVFLPASLSSIYRYLYYKCKGYFWPPRLSTTFTTIFMEPTSVGCIFGIVFYAFYWTSFLST